VALTPLQRALSSHNHLDIHKEATPLKHRSLRRQRTRQIYRFKVLSEECSHNRTLPCQLARRFSGFPASRQRIVLLLLPVSQEEPARATVVQQPAAVVGHNLIPA
jgi:hypothetical protein